MLRIDSEDTYNLNAAEQESLLAKVIELLTTRPIRAIILQDYNKGVLAPALIEAGSLPQPKSGHSTGG